MINKLRKKISIVNRTLKTKKHSYSFGGCDLLINYLFKNKKKGFYLDIGCQHPTFNNNTYLFWIDYINAIHRSDMGQNRS